MKNCFQVVTWSQFSRKKVHGLTVEKASFLGGLGFGIGFGLGKDSGYYLGFGTGLGLEFGCETRAKNCESEVT